MDCIGSVFGDSDILCPLLWTNQESDTAELVLLEIGHYREFTLLEKGIPPIRNSVVSITEGITCFWGTWAA